MGDSIHNDFIVIQVPSVEVKENGKDMFVTMLQLEKVLPFGQDHEMYRLVLDRDGYGCTLHFPRIPTLYNLSESDVGSWTRNMAMVLADRRSCTLVEEKALLNNHKALFTHLKQGRHDSPQSMVLQQHYSFVNEAGKVQCSLDYFNEEPSSSEKTKNPFEVQLNVVPFEATVGEELKKDGTTVKVKQLVFTLVWQLCIVKTTRVVTERQVANVNRLMSALRMTSANESMTTEATGR